MMKHLLVKNNKYIGVTLDILRNLKKSLFFLKTIHARTFSFLMVNFLRNYISLNKNYFLNFKNLCKRYNLKKQYILPHSSYFINIAHPVKNILYRNIKAFIKEINICYKLGLSFLNFHPGYHLNIISEEESINILINSINYVLKKTKNIVLLIENTCGSGSSIGYDLKHIVNIINGVEDQSRIGICLDTCHMFSYGYKLFNFSQCDKFFDYFHRLIGLKYLKAIHLSESKHPFLSKKDRHTSLFKGYIGNIFFYWFMKNKLFDNKSIILETRNKYLWKTEISWLYSLI